VRLFEAVLPEVITLGHVGIREDPALSNEAPGDNLTFHSSILAFY
jgi:hypothetical protein